MRVAPTPVDCGKCNHEFIAELVMDCPITVTVAALKAVRCPLCHSGERVMLLTGKWYRDACERLKITVAKD